MNENSKMVVMVRESDMISAKSLLQLLSDAIDNMKTQMDAKGDLTDLQKAACGGAIEAVTDLHNLVLSQIHDSRAVEAFENADRGTGEFDA